MKGLSIIIPTYNEKENVCSLIEKIEDVMQKAKVEYEIIVVDDNSPDKTWQLVEALTKKKSCIRLIRRMKERGLSTAVMAGFDAARFDTLAAMDADLSHDPKILPAMFKKILSGNDLIVGKRKKTIGWPWYRKLISWAAALPAKLLLKLSIADPMSGYFMLSAGLYENYKQVLKANNEKPQGFKVLLDLAVKTNPKKISEVSFVFAQRKAGKSKLSTKVALEYIKMLIHLSRFVKFCLVGASGIFVNLGLLWLLTEFGKMFYLYSAAISIEISILTNFALNEKWTWADRAALNSSGVAILGRAGKFNLVSMGGLVINLVVLWFLTSIIGIYYIFSALIGILATTVWNYVVNEKWTW